MAIDTTKTVIVDSTTGAINYTPGTSPISLATQPDAGANAAKIAYYQQVLALVVSTGSAGFIPLEIPTIGA